MLMYRSAIAVAHIPATLLPLELSIVVEKLVGVGESNEPGCSATISSRN
jgi:hypothetical protein